MKFKKLLHNAILPTKANPGDAGLDLTAAKIEYDYEKGILIADTGLAVEIPQGYVGLLFMRSSGSNTTNILANCVGVIDSGYRGSLIMKFRPIVTNKERKPIDYKVGERVGQLVVVPFLNSEPELVEELSDTQRGAGGFGSSGR